MTLQDVELLAKLLSRAGMNECEVYWANVKLDELRAIVARHEAEQAALAQAVAQGKKAEPK